MSHEIEKFAEYVEKTLEGIREAEKILRQHAYGEREIGEICHIYMVSYGGCDLSGLHRACQKKLFDYYPELL